jgi:hypothetical protein
MVSKFAFTNAPCTAYSPAVIWLDLDVEFYPCPQGGPTFREFVKETVGHCTG